jgi:hypothetical protein
MMFYTVVVELITSSLLTKVSGLVVRSIIFNELLGGQWPLVSRPGCLAVLAHTAKHGGRMHTRGFAKRDLGFLSLMQGGDFPPLDSHPAETSVYTHEDRASL